MEDKKNDIVEHNKLTSISVPTTMEKLVPKFCTNIQMALLKNKNLVLTMAYSEGAENTASSAIIERIVIDLEHAQSLNNILTKLLEDSKNVLQESK
jgi:hypothetical protein